jgi:SAM-dependent methyltransferase
MSSMRSSSDQWDNQWKTRGIWVHVLDVARKKLNRVFWKIVSNHLFPDGVFLEVGCGSGAFVLFVAQQHRRAIGLDLSSAAISRARSEIHPSESSRAEFLVANALAMPLEDESVDVIWSQGVLQEMADRRAFLAEQWRVLRPGGTILATVPAKHSVLWFWHGLSRLPLLGFLWPWPEHPFLESSDLMALANLFSRDYSIHRGGVLGELWVMELHKTRSPPVTAKKPKKAD